jgi:tetratricopeptide (TPR) repeat protein
MEAARALAPDDARHAANLAWMLATAPEPGLRDAKRALELIEPLIAASDPDPDLLDTAAAALSALGRWEEAIERIELALELARLADSWAVEDLELRRTALRNRQPVVDQIAAARAAAEAR